LGQLDVLETERAGHATELTGRTLRDGCAHVVSVGGDGTHHEVVNGFFDADATVNPDARLSILPLGTGSDLARTLQLSDLDCAVAALSGGITVDADVGRVRYTRDDGEPASRYFINTLHMGLGGAVSERVNHTSKVLGGFASFLWGAIATMATYTNTPMTLTLDDACIEQPCSDVIVANAQYDGGGMHVAPQARLDDGLLDVFVIGDVSRIQAFQNLPRVYRGTLHERPDIVQCRRVRKIEAHSDEAVLLNLDGERPGRLPASIEVVPGAIRLTTA
jgi:YegS/Rv2252/BmrU family lipid kinase